MAVDLNDPEFIAQLARRERARPLSRVRLPLLAALALLYLTPFYYLLVTVAKTGPEYAAGSILALPHSLAPLLENLRQAWTLGQLGRAALNSLGYGLFGAAAAVALAAAAAYGLTRMRLGGATGWFMLIFSGTLFPFQMYLVPLLFGYQCVGMANSWLAMLLLYIAICIPFPLLVLRNSFAGIGKEMDEAARLDGAGEWRIFASLLIPNAKGPLVALFLLQFTFIWNDLLFSSVLANSDEVRSIMVALQSLQGTYSTTGPNVVMAATLISSVPTVGLFLVLRKHFMAGLQLRAQ